MTLEPPVFVTVSDRDLLLPTVTLLKPMLVGFDPNTLGATPAPDSGMFSVGLDAFEMIETLPLTLAAEAGVNVTLKLALWPPVSVTGAVIPLKVKPAPLIPTCEIVTLEPPVLVIVPDRAWLLPTVTLPKLRVVGFDPSAPGVTAVADNGMVRVGFEAVEVMVTLPVTLPADTGVNVTVNAALWPAVSVAGVVIPLRLNPVPVIPTCEIVTLDAPVLVNVSERD